MAATESAPDEDHKSPEAEIQQPPKTRFFIRSPGDGGPELSPFITVAEDIAWLRDTWLDGPSPATAELRRGSAVLRRLLVNGLLNEAWRFHGLDGGPKIVGPNLLGLLSQQGIEPRHVLTVIAGGAERQNIVTASVGAWRAFNPSTGISADADEGFAVVTGSVSRHTLGPRIESPLTPFVEAEHKLGAYLNAPGAIRLGQTVSRGLIIQYFANFAGGVHLDRVAERNPAKRAKYDLVAELERKASVLDMDGIFFELLSIGQALARSPDILKLETAILNWKPGKRS